MQWQHNSLLDLPDPLSSGHKTRDREIAILFCEQENNGITSYKRLIADNSLDISLCSLLCEYFRLLNDTDLIYPWFSIMFTS